MATRSISFTQQPDRQTEQIRCMSELTVDGSHENKADENRDIRERCRAVNMLFFALFLCLTF